MKKALLFAALLYCTAAFSQRSTTYTGNGKNNFGGAVGEGVLTVSETDTSLSFALAKGPGLFDSLLVFYVDVIPGGIATTAGLTGSSTDRYLAAVAGHNPAHGRAVLNFPNDFQPDGVVVFDKDSGSLYVFFLEAIIKRESFSVDSSASAYTGSGSKARLGLTGSLNFKFIGTYIGRSASRSAEAFGDAFDGYARPSGTLSYNPYTVNTYFTYTSGVLPVKLTDFKAAKDGDAVNVRWSVANENDIEKYEVQRSTDGINFYTISTVRAGNSPVSLTYNTRDASAQNGVNYYRLIIVERGRAEVSRVISLNLQRRLNNLVASVLSPAMLNLKLNSLNAATYTLRVISHNGQVVHTSNIKAGGSYQNRQVQLSKSLARGIYTVTLQSAMAKYTAGILVQ